MTNKLSKIFSVHAWRAPILWEIMFAVWAIFAILYAFADVMLGLSEALHNMPINASLIACVGAIIMCIGNICTGIMVHRWLKFHSDAKGCKSTRWIQWIMIGFSVFMIIGVYAIDCM